MWVAGRYSSILGTGYRMKREEGDFVVTVVVSYFWDASNLFQKLFFFSKVC